MGNGPRLRIWDCRHCRFKRKDEGSNGESSRKHAREDMTMKRRDLIQMPLS